MAAAIKSVSLRSRLRWGQPCWRLPAASSGDMKIWWMFVRSPSGGVGAARVCVWMCAGDWGQGMPLCMPQCGLSKAAAALDVIKISTRLLFCEFAIWLVALQMLYANKFIGDFWRPWKHFAARKTPDLEHSQIEVPYASWESKCNNGQ